MSMWSRNQVCNRGFAHLQVKWNVNNVIKNGIVQKKQQQKHTIEQVKAQWLDIYQDIMSGDTLSCILVYG